MNTTTRTLSSTTIEEVCEYAEIDEDGITRAYAGRGMYGATCFGVVMPRAKLAPFLMMLGALTTEGATLRDVPLPTEQAVELGVAVRTDSMGHDLIVYFPGWSLT
jgi:hypothetical protein